MKGNMMNTIYVLIMVFWLSNGTQEPHAYVVGNQPDNCQAKFAEVISQNRDRSDITDMTFACLQTSSDK